VELVVAMVIIGVLASLGAPAYSSWISNMKVRNLSESVQSALNFARAEAVRRNMQVTFRLMDSIDNACGVKAVFNAGEGVNWVVSLDNAIGGCGAALLDDRFPVTDAANNPPPRILLKRAANEGVGGLGVSAGASSFIFDGMGRLVTAPAQIDISDPNQGLCKSATVIDASRKVRCLRVVVTAAGQVRMCDPAYAAGDTQGCS